MKNNSQTKTFKNNCQNCNKVEIHEFKQGFIICPKCGHKTYIKILNIWSD